MGAITALSVDVKDDWKVCSLWMECYSLGLSSDVFVLGGWRSLNKQCESSISSSKHMTCFFRTDHFQIKMFFCNSY